MRNGRLEDVWRLRKEEIGAESVERAALVRVGDRWRVYPSYVGGEDRKWRIGFIESSSIDGFDARAMRPVLDPDAVGMAAVKDPWLVRERDRWLMFVS